MSHLRVSQRRIAANRRNALKSTGPRTRAGKKRSSLTALKHGVRGKNPQLDDLIDLSEAPRAFEAFRRCLEDSIQPSTDHLKDLRRLKIWIARAQAGGLKMLISTNEPTK